MTDTAQATNGGGHYTEQMEQVDIQSAAALSGALLVLVLTTAAVQIRGKETQSTGRPPYRAFFVFVSLYLLLYAVQLRQEVFAIDVLLDSLWVCGHCLLVLGALRRSERSFPFWPVLLFSLVYFALDKVLLGEQATRLSLGYSLCMSLLAGALLLTRRRGANFGDIAMAATNCSWAALLLIAIAGLGAERFQLLNLTLILIFALPMITALGVFLFLSYTLDERESLDNLASRDALTTLHNRRYLAERAVEILSLMRRQNAPVALIMLDVDHFKKINDELGHGTGDRALQAIAESLLRDSRLEDLVARYGGEEFVVLLPNTTLQEALAKAERLRQGIEAIDLPGIRAGELTASFGVSHAKAGAEVELDTFLRAADAALYDAKAAGRNTIREAAPMGSKISLLASSGLQS